MTARKPDDQRRREGGSARKGAVSHRPAPGIAIPPESAEGIRIPSENGGPDENPAPNGGPGLPPELAHELTADLLHTKRRIAKLLEVIAQEGEFSAGSNGQLRRHPAIISIERAQEHVARLERRLGAAANVPEPEEDVPPLAEVLFEALGPNPRAGALDWDPVQKRARIFP